MPNTSLKYENHAFIQGKNGKILANTLANHAPTFIVPHNFEIIFWNDKGKTMDENHANCIRQALDTLYESNAYCEKYTQGSICPDHSLDLKLIDLQRIGIPLDHINISRFLNGDTTNDFSSGIKLSFICLTFFCNSVFTQDSKNNKTVIHWCSDRKFLFPSTQ